ncbi:ester cyclase [Actinoplanes sp. NPDC051411]|uniref:ester cyclase n=1 Tax=Actinoplanes sp. NPDC051411 TaxID=3155522 RepID=UPI003429DD76
MTPKQVVHAFYDSYNGKDLEASFDRYIADGLVNHAMGGAFDRAAWLDVDRTWFPAFTDFTATVLDQVAEGDKVATRVRMGGTHTGAPFAGVDASGHSAFLTISAIDRVADGRIVEHWSEFDFAGFLVLLTDAPRP